MLKKLNDKLYLSLQLWNGPEGSLNRVFCTLKNQSMALVEAEFEVAHTSNGFFLESVKEMPAVDVLFAFFRITESDGVTQSYDHAFSTQRYDRDYTGEQVQNLRPIAATITGEVSTANAIAEVSNSNIIGEVAEVEVVSYLGNEEDVNGFLSNNNLIGEIQ